MDKEPQAAQSMMAEAFNYLQKAIELLDAAGAAGHIAANVDLAMNQLMDELGRLSGVEPARTLEGSGCRSSARPS